MVYHVMDRMMRKKPGERYQSATTLIRDLERTLDQIRAGVTLGEETQNVKSSAKALSSVQRISSRRRGRKG